MARRYGTGEDDVLNGTNRSDSIWGYEGADTLNGLRGNDRIYAGEGDDTVDGGRGRDTVFGGDGNDNISGGRGNDRLFGEDDNDTISGGRGRDFIVGGDGEDNIDGGAGRDYILGDYDPLFFGSDSVGELTSDLLRGGSGSDYVNGQLGNDTAVYNLSDNTRSNGRTYRDTYVGGDGEDTLRLEFTTAQWDGNTDLQEDVLAFRDAIETTPGAEYSFSEFRLTASEFEALEVYVDGEPIDLGGGSGEVVDAVDDEFDVQADGSVEGDVLANDTGASDFRTTLLTEPDKGDLNIAVPDGEFTYTPGDEFRSLAEGQEETVTFTYSAEDAGDPDNNDEATVTITVQGVNDDPEAIAFARTFSELDGSKAVNLLNSKKVSDIDEGDVLSIVDDSVAVTLGDDTEFTDFIVQNNGRIRIDYSQFDYLNEGESETLTVDYTITDDKGGTAENTLTITVNGAGEPDPENVAPVAMDDVDEVGLDGTASKDATDGVLFNDTDDDGPEAMTVSTVNGEASNVGVDLDGKFGTLTLDDDGSYDYTANYASDADAPPGVQTVSFEPVGETPADISNWSDGEVTTDESDLGSFLGVFDDESGTTGTFTLSGEQQSVVISFDIYEFGQWEASGAFEDTLTITVDDNDVPDDDPAVVLEEQFTDNTGKVADTGDGSEFRTSLGFVDTGFTGKAAVAEVWHYEFAFLTGSNTLGLSFLGDLSGGMDNEGWGIDNIQIVERGVDEFAYTASDGEDESNEATLSIDTEDPSEDAPGYVNPEAEFA